MSFTDMVRRAPLSAPAAPRSSWRSLVIYNYITLRKDIAVVYGTVFENDDGWCQVKKVLVKNRVPNTVDF